MKQTKKNVKNISKKRRRKFYLAEGFLDAAENDSTAQQGCKTDHVRAYRSMRRCDVKTRELQRKTNSYFFFFGETCHVTNHYKKKRITYHCFQPTCNNSGAAGSGRFRQIDLEMQRCAALNLFNLKRSTISRSYKAGVHSETEEMEKQLHFAFVDALPVLTTALLLKTHVPVAACQRNIALHRPRGLAWADSRTIARTRAHEGWVSTYKKLSELSLRFLLKTLI